MADIMKLKTELDPVKLVVSYNKKRIAFEGLNIAPRYVRITCEQLDALKKCESAAKLIASHGPRCYFDSLLVVLKNSKTDYLFREGSRLPNIDLTRLEKQ